MVTASRRAEKPRLDRQSDEAMCRGPWLGGGQECGGQAAESKDEDVVAGAVVVVVVAVAVVVVVVGAVPRHRQGMRWAE